ncbi:MAG TPA: type I-E CRISPR-associated protein Cas5/CasD [Turneriella sp.]|nr:type I-E CRISPR-associated protein Cas5/CasD [Turneriella sp.]
MREYLLFRLYGPLASWGDIAVGEYRPSYSYPSKSAICGLLAAALGIDRIDDESHLDLSRSVQFALCVLAPGSLLRDYHTIQTPGNTRRHLSTRKDELADRLNIATILSSRDYRMDAAYDACISLKEDSQYDLAQIKGALERPKYTLYLGRKSCVVALPLCPRLLQAESALRALQAYETVLKDQEGGIKSEVSGLLAGGNSVTYLWEEDNSDEYTHIQTRRDSVLSRRRWQFAERQEKYKMIGKERDIHV